jgi:FixJ family two-component response regulator
MREGAIDFLVKPIGEAELLGAIRRALDTASAQERGVFPEARWRSVYRD